MRNDERTGDMAEEMNNTRLETVNCNQEERKKKEKNIANCVLHADKPP
jgi:hypothetical protein